MRAAVNEAATIQPAIPPIESDPLRLMFCPKCDYSLQGLPPEGTCPECGREYDQSFTIIRCRPTSFWRVAPIVCFMATLAFLEPVRRNPIFLLFAGLIIINIAVQLIEQFTSPRRGVRLLWMSPIGIGVKRLADDKALHVRLSEIAAAVFVLGIVVYFAHKLGGKLLVALFDRIGWSAAIIIFIVGAAIALIATRLSQPRFVRRSDGVAPDLWPWQDLDRIEIDRMPCPPGDVP